MLKKGERTPRTKGRSSRDLTWERRAEVHSCGVRHGPFNSLAARKHRLGSLPQASRAVTARRPGAWCSWCGMRRGKLHKVCNGPASEGALGGAPYLPLLLVRIEPHPSLFEAGLDRLREPRARASPAPRRTISALSYHFILLAENDVR